LATEGKFVDEKLVKDRESNPLLKLEGMVSDEQKRREEMPRIHQNIMINEKFKDDYKANSLMRKLFRNEKKEIEKTGVLFADSEHKIKLKDLDYADIVCYVNISL
jgi:hypothetical protein